MSSNSVTLRLLKLLYSDFGLLRMLSACGSSALEDIDQLSCCLDQQIVPSKSHWNTHLCLMGGMHAPRYQDIGEQH
jgi:hypothetical protein